MLEHSTESRVREKIFTYDHSGRQLLRMAIKRLAYENQGIGKGGAALLIYGMCDTQR
jgi:hypothetical protein